jgi:hypothetical protein
VSDSNEINSLLDELSSFSIPSPNTHKATQDTSPLMEEDLQQYVLNKTKALVEASLGAVQDLAPMVASTGDAKEVDALSKMVASTAQALDALQKTALINKKAERDEKLERMRHEGRKEIAMLTQGPQHVTNNNILVASREEIMKKLFGDKEEPKQIN